MLGVRRRTGWHSQYHRAGEHAKRFEYLDEIGGGLTRNEARAVEQAIINSNSFENRINSISSPRDSYQEAVDSGAGWLFEHGIGPRFEGDGI